MICNEERVRLFIVWSCQLQYIARVELPLIAILRTGKQVCTRKTQHIIHVCRGYFVKMKHGGEVESSAIRCDGMNASAWAMFLASTAHNMLHACNKGEGWMLYHLLWQKVKMPLELAIGANVGCGWCRRVPCQRCSTRALCTDNGCQQPIPHEMKGRLEIEIVRDDV